MLSQMKLLCLGLFLGQVHGLYFLINGQEKRCFIEDLPKGTLVVGKYKATHWSDQAKAYTEDPAMGIHITVEEIFDHDHRVVNQQGAGSGKFTFSAADAGAHHLCFQPTNVQPAALFGHSASGTVKFELDMVIGETSAIESSDKDKIVDVVQKVKDLNARLQDIRREQVYQREREAEFRDQSENVNARVVRWTLIQLAVLAVTCAWQLSYLRAFFIKQKLT